MDSDRPAVARGPDSDAPTFEDVITGAVQEALDAEEGGDDGHHIVTDWVLVAEVIGPDGRTFNHVRYSDEDVMFSRAMGMLAFGNARAILDLRAETEGEE